MTEEANEVEEVAELSEVGQKIKDAFDDNIESDEDSIKMAMLQAGCKFKAVSRLYNQYMIDAGLLATKEEKTDAIVNALDSFDVSEEDGFGEAVSQVAESVSGVTGNSAATMIRSYCKREEIEVFSKPKGVHSTGFRFKFYEELRSNPSMNAEEALVFIKEHGSENDKRAYSHYQAIRKLVNEVS